MVGGSWSVQCLVPAGGTRALHLQVQPAPRSPRQRPGSQPRTFQLWLRTGGAPGRSPKTPPSPAPSVPVPAAERQVSACCPLYFASVAARFTPFPGCVAARGSAGMWPGESGGCTLRGDADPGTTSCRGPGEDPGSRRAAHRRTAAPRRRKDARPAPGLERTEPGLGVSGCARAVPL